MKKCMHFPSRASARSLASLFLLALAISTSAAQSADGKSTLNWDFSGGELSGWQVVTGDPGFYLGGLAAADEDGRDKGHATTVVRSPMFRINGSGDIEIMVKSGAGKNIPATAREVLSQTRTNGRGPLGVALRRVTDDAYVLVAEKTGNDTQTLKFTKAQLAKLLETSYDEVYTLDYIDGFEGGWGHQQLIKVKVPGSMIDPLPAPPKDFGEAERHLFLGSMHGKLLFDKKELWAAPGSKVSLTLFNSDEMAHNFILCQPGDKVATELGDYVMNNLDAMLKAGYVPPDKRIIAHTPLVAPGTSATIYMDIPKAEGDYPYVCTFPGHHLLMRGILKVSKNPPKPTQQQAKPVTPKDPFIVSVGTEPLIVRGPLDGAGSATICVGTPSGSHFAFDTGRCVVAQTWTSEDGTVVNTKAAWSGRGGNALRTVGNKKYSAGKDEMTLKIGDAEPDFRGYEIGDDGYPIFFYNVGDSAVSVRVSPVDGGLDAAYKIDPAPSSATYTLGQSQSIGDESEKGKAVKVGGSFNVHFSTK